MPEMGIAGAGLASTIAEVFAAAVFIIYMYLIDKKAVTYKIFEWPRIKLELIKQQIRISTPIILQSVVGLGSWFIFFIFVEEMGETPLSSL